MNICILQFDIAWMDFRANIDMIKQLLSETEEKAALVVLPEMFLTGFNMNAVEAAIEEKSEWITLLIDICKSFDLGLIGSLAIFEEGKYYNRMLLIDKDGIQARYDKQHLFTPSGEQKIYSTKHPLSIMEFNGWTILPQICYDLRFAESMYKLPVSDLIVYSANWPSSRILHWDVLLRARAIENQCYTIGCNRIGTDKNEWVYPGSSQLVLPDGKVIELGGTKGVLEVSIEKTSITDYRKKYPFLNDRKR